MALRAIFSCRSKNHNLQKFFAMIYFCERVPFYSVKMIANATFPSNVSTSNAPENAIYRSALGTLWVENFSFINLFVSDFHKPRG